MATTETGLNTLLDQLYSSRYLINPRFARGPLSGTNPSLLWNLPRGEAVLNYTGSPDVSVPGQLDERFTPLTGTEAILPGMNQGFNGPEIGGPQFAPTEIETSPSRRIPSPQLVEPYNRAQLPQPYDLPVPGMTGLVQQPPAPWSSR